MYFFAAFYFKKNFLINFCFLIYYFTYDADKGIIFYSGMCSK